MHENSIPSEALTHAQSRSPSVSSDRTITPFHPPCEVPRPKPPPEYPIPVYTPDPSDPTKFLNVPRPRLRQQWHIPADCYNGAAWEDHRKFELETGAISALYPDKWFRGQSFGSAVKDAEGKARAIRGTYLSFPTVQPSLPNQSCLQTRTRIKGPSDVIVISYILRQT